MNQESLRIVLRTYSKGGINEDEAVQLIEDLSNNRVTYNPTPYWPSITYDEGDFNINKFKKYEITCKAE